MEGITYMFIKIYGRQNALVLNECYAHLRVLLYTFSKECCSLYRRMLHRGMPQLPQEMPHSFKFSTMTYEKHALALRIWVDVVLGFNNTFFSKEQYAYPCKTFHISFCRELCREDAMLLGDKMKSSVNQTCCFLLFMLAIKTCNIDVNTTLSFEHGATGQNWNFSLIFPG